MIAAMVRVQSEFDKPAIGAHIVTSWSSGSTNASIILRTVGIVLLGVAWAANVSGNGGEEENSKEEEEGQETKWGGHGGGQGEEVGGEEGGGHRQLGWPLGGNWAWS